MHFGSMTFDRLTPKARTAFDKHRANGMTRSQAFLMVACMSGAMVKKTKPKKVKRASASRS